MHLQTLFNTILNREMDEPVRVPDTLPILPGITASAHDNLFDGNPKLVELDRQRKSYEIQEHLANKAGYPMVGIGVDYSLIGMRDDPDLAMNGQDAVMPMMSVTLPIFRKKYKAAQKEAELMGRATGQEMQLVKNELYAGFSMAVHDHEKAAELTGLYQKQTETTEQAVKLLLTGYSNDTSDINEILSMNQDLLMYRTGMVTQIKASFVAQSKIAYLLSKAE
jgi:hypothetical protein